MTKIFISYSDSDDGKLGYVLAGFLRQEGNSVWLKTRLKSGESWRKENEWELWRADAVVVIWTNKSVGTDWVIQEAMYARRNKKLISLRAKDLTLTLPKPFDNIRTVPEGDRPAILRAVAAIAGAVDSPGADDSPEGWTLHAPSHISAAEQILRLALWITMAIGLAIVVAGVVLVVLGTAGQLTELTLFGNTFKSETVGAVGIFCGAVLVILNVRRVMRSVERLGAPPPDKPSPRPRKRRR